MKTGTLAPELLRKLDAHWRAANYLSVGQIYLYDNPLVKQPLELTHIKPRLLGHWGTTPGLNFIYAHLNRVIKEHDLNAIYFTGPGHGGPGLVPNAWRRFRAAGLLSRHDRRHAGTGKLGRAVRHGRVGRCFVGVRRGFRMEQANGRDMGRPQKSSSAGFAARPARSVREVFAVLLTVGLFALEMAFPR